MHVWGRAKENKAGRSEGNMLEERASNKRLSTRANIKHHMAGSKSITHALQSQDAS